ncbi:MAG TPA: glutathione S-transferase family protein [Anaeromyxobacter sp.]|nr:glutathione S-transferase family protein [Anaeromyxobacter sp.]
MPAPLKLVSFELCPYVERSRIALLEKDVPHGVEFIDLAAKPDWFLRISPMGRVPVLLVGDRPIFESMVINELIDELHPRPPLMPEDPLARAEARAWIVFANDEVMPTTYATMVGLAGGDGVPALERQLADLEEALGKLEAQIGRGGGPWFMGTRFTLVDAAYAPFVRRWRVAEGWGLPARLRLGAFPVLSTWAAALLDRPSVRAAEPRDFAARTRKLHQDRAARRAQAGG